MQLFQIKDHDLRISNAQVDPGNCDEEIDDYIFLYCVFTFLTLNKQKMKQIMMLFYPSVLR